MFHILNLVIRSGRNLFWVCLTREQVSSHFGHKLNAVHGIILLRFFTFEFPLSTGGDVNYEGDDEENREVISRWAKRKVSSQFSIEYLDGRKSFIFSWNKQHRAIHEEALFASLWSKQKRTKVPLSVAISKPTIKTRTSISSKISRISKSTETQKSYS